MNFTQFNKSNFEKIEWNLNTEGFAFKKLADFFKSGEKTIQVFGFFFTKSDEYGLQPVAIAKDCLVNLPKHKKDVISEMLENADCVNAIKNGECSLKLRKYKSKYNKECYDFDFIDTPKAETTETTETTEKQADIF